MAAISIRNLSKAYGRVEVLHDIALEIADNSFVVLVGPSGCGKSTLLRTVAGLEDATSGSVLLDGRDISAEAPVDRDVAMVFQSYALYPQMTVRQNIGFALEVAGTPKRERARRVDEVAALLKLDALLERRPADLSGGQRQRVAIGRAILREPAVFLFDEPLSNLDAELRVDMRLQIAALRRTLSATFVYVTHDQTEAMTLADTIVVLREGRVEQVGPPMVLYAEPANLFVARFLGSPRMNTLAATLEGGCARLGSGERVPLEAAFGPDGTPVTLGLRPEHLLVSPDGALGVTIEAIENLGALSYAYGTPAGGERVAVQLPPEHAFSLGDALRLDAAPGRVHVFDADGRRLRAATDTDGAGDGHGDGHGDGPGDSHGGGSGTVREDGRT